MKNDYITLVVAELELGVKKLYIAPWLARLNQGDEVIVEADGDDVRHGIVVYADSALPYDHTAELLLTLFDESYPLKRVISKIEYVTYEYEEEEEEDAETTERNQ